MSPTALTDLIIHDELSPPPEDIEPIDDFDAVCLDIEYWPPSPPPPTPMYYHDHPTYLVPKPPLKRMRAHAYPGEHLRSILHREKRMKKFAWAAYFRDIDEIIDRHIIDTEAHSTAHNEPESIDTYHQDTCTGGC